MENKLEEAVSLNNDTAKEIKKIGMETESQILEWKNKYGDVFELSVEDDDETAHIAYLRKPKMKEINTALKYLSKQERLLAGYTLIQDCFVGGSIKIKDDEDYTISAALSAIDIIEIKLSEIKKK